MTYHPDSIEEASCRYLILWQTKTGGKVFPFEEELPTSWAEADQQVRDWIDTFYLVEVREVETGKDVTAEFFREPKPSSEGYADAWIKGRKEEHALTSKGLEAAEKHSYFVRRLVEIEVKLEAFSDEFMSEFRQSFYDFNTLEDHLEHLSWLAASGRMDSPLSPAQFIEGYGQIGEFLTSVSVGDFDAEVVY